MKNAKNPEFTRENNLIRELVMIDGIGRSGKSMFAHIISSFARVEKQHNFDIFEWLGIAWNFGKITTQAAVALLRLEGDQRLYNAFIGRDTNFRESDDTGIFKNAHPVRYLQRLFMNDGQEAVERCIKERPIMQACIHDGIRNAELFFKAFEGRLKMIYVIRDPVPLVYEWQNNNFGDSYGKRLREFHITFNWAGGVMPYSAVGWEDEYLSIKSHDRAIPLINSHFNLNIGGYLKFDKKKKKNIMIVRFEDMATNPLPECERIARFIGTETTAYTADILRRERCPRVLDPVDRKQQISSIESKASPKYVEMFRTLLEKYESRYWEGVN